ncbi:Ger(x)C family spore germination protein [Paenibacillus sp. CC-CFT742]|uniref:Ger(x)C family spore germination protein n=1 Tax=Paenibacillus illinoisensis TaxID=59845 RepID=UPI00203B4E3B|nr:Ger(x)C family spore germination protein [Paenibacillus sp. CC-CFT742]MCM3203055.1 Ger(x)C family spore germination protein [Paenibacillus illinoisensis]WJH29613.1 Ger(x)C family spore germination protein [Paenibacillus sp. CC-CFT742]
MIRCFYILMFLVSTISVAGCGNRTELNELGITTAAGYDRQNGNWMITYQIIVPPASSINGSSGGSQSSVTTFSSQGKTIREAVAKSSLENPNKIYFSHTNVILIGQEAAQYGLSEILDDYYRNIDARESVKVIIADGQAKDYLKKLIPPDKQPGQALSQIIERNHELGSYYPVMNLHDIALKITSDSGSAGIPIVAVKGQDSRELESIDIFKQTSTRGKLKLEGLSVFYKDKQIGVLNQRESMGISWLTDRVARTNLSYVNRRGEVNSFFVRNASVKVQPIKSGHHYSIQVNAKVKAELDESTTLADITSPHIIDELQLQAEQIITSQMMEGWNASQRLHVDMLGIANKIHQRHPKDWKTLKEKWPHELAQMEININVDVSLKRTGLLQDSFSRLLHKESGKSEGEH